MPPEAAISSSNVMERSTAVPILPIHQKEGDSLFEHVDWLYAFCREHVFRNDTDRIVAALWPNAGPEPGIRMIELGCGPGFYSRRVAERYPDISVVGVDQSQGQLRRARARAHSHGLSNCRFERIDALDLSCSDAEFDVVLASRLFTILPEQDRVIAQIFRVLKPGGRCFIAEPRHAVWASLPLVAMWLLASLIHFRNGYREPHTARVFSSPAFGNLFRAQPWKRIKVWQDGRYHYAVCEKD